MRSVRSMTPAKQQGSSSPRAWVPDAYQQEAIKWILSRKEGLLFLEPGLGKTTIAASAFKLLQKKSPKSKALVIAPRRVAQLVWSQNPGGELAEYPATFGDIRVSLLHGKEKDDAAFVDADLYVINPDGLQWLIERGHLKRLVAQGVDTLIVDELSKFKHSTSKRFKLMKPYLDLFKRRWGMTGSPASNGLIDLFGQVYIVDRGQRLGRFITNYRNRYFTPSGYGGYTWKPQPGAEERIYEALSDIALSMRAEDHIDLPELVTQTLWVNLPPAARKLYDGLEEELIAQLEDKVVVATSQAVASGKCRQVASGGLYLETQVTIAGHVTNKRETKVVHDEKTEALCDLVEELQGNPLLVAYEFDHDLERIRAALGKDVPAINGRTSDKQAFELVRAWNAGELPVLCGHPAAMGHGLNLQKGGNHVCWYSLTWDFELYDQLNRRVRRRGQARDTVFLHHLLARDTIDVVMLKRLTSKDRTQQSLLTALRDLRHAK